MRKKELALPELVTGYDNHGSPILNWDKINEIKGGIEHHFRYLLSTWGEINYAEVNVDWERVEARNGDGKLITAENPKTGKRKVLDEDWYVLDEKGNRTESRADPETFLRSREMTRLESMFGTDALVFIQAEIERQKLNTNKNVISVIDERTGKPIRVDISAAENPKDRSKFAQAVWQGAFDYLVASEIIGHRTHGSGDEYYDAEALKKAFDALRVGQVMEPAQIQKIIRKQTNTGTRKMYGQDLGYAFAVGGSGGIWKMFEAMFKDIVSGK